MDADRLLDETAALLRARGERMTGPRRAVLLALARNPGHHAPDDVARLVADLDATVHRSSVYRCLEALRSLGVVQHVHVGHGATVYHLTDTEAVHAQCRHCGALFTLPASVLDAAGSALRDEHGFALDATHVALSGTCADCLNA
ncbi:MAG TPA: transcriptional repressor [Propionibacterium sp.]|nr:transcriptional repressor [Propionibacterium sp.]